MTARTAAQGSFITETRQIRALASPVRQDIVDVVTAIGPCSVAEIAVALAKPADGLYYHINRLLQVRLLKRVASGENGQLRLDVAHKSQHLKYDPASRANREAVLRVVGAMVRSAERAFQRGFRPGVAVVEGPDRNLWAGRARAVLSADELAQVNVLVDQLLMVLRSGRQDRSTSAGVERGQYEFTFILAPVTAR